MITGLDCRCSLLRRSVAGQRRPAEPRPGPRRLHQSVALQPLGGRGGAFQRRRGGRQLLLRLRGLLQDGHMLQVRFWGYYRMVRPRFADTVLCCVMTVSRTNSYNSLAALMRLLLYLPFSFFHCEMIYS